TLAIGAPLAAAVNGFNWVTAIALAAVCPVGFWLSLHRGAYHVAFRGAIHSFVMDVLTLRVVRPSRIDPRTWLAARGESPASHRGRRGAPLTRRDDREYREYLSEEQRSQRGCIAGRMQADFHRGLLTATAAAALFLAWTVV